MIVGYEVVCLIDQNLWHRVCCRVSDLSTMIMLSLGVNLCHLLYTDGLTSSQLFFFIVFFFCFMDFALGFVFSFSTLSVLSLFCLQ